MCEGVHEDEGWASCIAVAVVAHATLVGFIVTVFKWVAKGWSLRGIPEWVTVDKVKV